MLHLGLSHREYFRDTLLLPLIASGKLAPTIPGKPSIPQQRYNTISQRSVCLMNELHLQDKFLIPLFRDGLGYTEVKANTVAQSLIIEEDLQATICLHD